jgi:hypothetical protein
MISAAFAKQGLSKGLFKRSLFRAVVLAFGIALGASLGGCTHTGIVYGLNPQYPKVTFGNTFTVSPAFPTVDSTQPTLRWEPFPPPRDAFGTKQEREGRIRDITYELRIWRYEGPTGGALVYSRDDLREPRHKVASALDRDTEYLWSVRARFLLDGQLRITEWGQFIETTVMPAKLVLNSRESSLHPPNAMRCYRFGTP